MNEETYDAHVEYTCTRNRNFLKQYGQEDKFGEVDIEILKTDFGWDYSSPVNVSEQQQQPLAPPTTPPATRRRHASKAESIPSPVSPRSSSRNRKVEKQSMTPVKKTRSGRTIKIPQVDGVPDTDSEAESSVPQFDGHNGPPQQPQQQPQQAPPSQHRVNYGNEQSGGYFVGEQTPQQPHHHQNGPYPGVIPILMPPGRIFHRLHQISFHFGAFNKGLLLMHELTCYISFDS